MKRGKKLIGLLAVLVVLMAATWAAGKFNPENEPEEDTSFAVYTLDTSAVTAIGWDYSEALSFTRTEGGWTYDADAAFPLDESYLDTMLSTLAEIRATKTIESPDDLDQYGLEVPVCTVTVTTDTTQTLSIGQETAMGGERYFSSGDGNVYLVDADLIGAFSYGLYEILEYESIPDMEEITGLTVTSDVQSYDIRYLENSGLSYSDDYVWFLGDQALDTQLTTTLISTAAAFTWDTCVDYSAEDLSLYGLDPCVAEVTFAYQQSEETETGETDEAGNAVTETVVTPKTFTLELGATTENGTYARIAGSNMVYLIDSAVSEMLLYTTRNELLPDEVISLDWDTVQQIDVILEGTTYEILRQEQTVTDDDGNESEETIWLLGGEEVSVSTITGALEELASTGYATGLTPEGAEELRFVFHRDHDTWPQVELAFYPYDSAACLTTLNGASTVLADRTGVAALLEIVKAVVS